MVALFSIKLLLNIEKYYIITKMTAPLQYSVWWEKRSLKFKFELWQPMKVKRANRLMSIIDEIWVIHLQKVDTLSTIGIYNKYFHIISVIMVLYTYKYWFKMLKRWKFPRLIKAHASSTNCTMGNLATQHTCI